MSPSALIQVLLNIGKLIHYATDCKSRRLRLPPRQKNWEHDLAQEAFVLGDRDVLIPYGGVEARILRVLDSEREVLVEDRAAGVGCLRRLDRGLPVKQNVRISASVRQHVTLP